MKTIKEKLERLLVDYSIGGITSSPIYELLATKNEDDVHTIICEFDRKQKETDNPKVFDYLAEQAADELLALPDAK